MLKKIVGMMMGILVASTAISGVASASAIGGIEPKATVTAMRSPSVRLQSAIGGVEPK